MADKPVVLVSPGLRIKVTVPATRVEEFKARGYHEHTARPPRPRKKREAGAEGE